MNRFEGNTVWTFGWDRFRHRNRERWLHRVLMKTHQQREHGFFDEYPQFFETSTLAAPDRINQRYHALIEWNLSIIAGKRVLDLASHDGRWSFAAYKAGAEYVLGIEARPHLVEAAQQNMRSYGVGNQVAFRCGDVMAEEGCLCGQFDTVFCFGFLYHTLDHMALLRKISRLNPRQLVIDTAISIQRGALVEVEEEETEHESTAAFAEPGSPGRALKGVPTRSALELMLKAAGFRNLEFYDWHHAAIGRWTDLADYYLGKRLTLRASAVSCTA